MTGHDALAMKAAFLRIGIDCCDRAASVGTPTDGLAATLHGLADQMRSVLFAIEVQRRGGGITAAPASDRPADFAEMLARGPRREAAIDMPAELLHALDVLAPFLPLISPEQGEMIVDCGGVLFAQVMPWWSPVPHRRAEDVRHAIVAIVNAAARAMAAPGPPTRPPLRAV